MTTPPDHHALRTATAASVLALFASGVLASCFLSGYDKVEGGEGGAGSTTASVASTATQVSSASQGGAGGEGLPQCETTEYPEGPSEAPTNPALDRWFALRSVALGNIDEPVSVPGFDLDLVDSCNDACRGIRPECTRPAYLANLTAKEEEERCDWPEAVDNSAVRLFDAAQLLGISDDALSAQAEAGEWSLLIRVSAWNGTENDAEVTVSLYSTTGYQPPPPGGSSSSAGAGGAGGAEPPQPQWDGSDTWGIDSRSLDDPADLETPSFRTVGGYVSDGTLVAEIGGTFYVGSARIPLRIATGRLLAPLTQQSGMTGAVFAGRWPIDQLIVSIGSLLVGPEQQFCDQTELFDPFAATACRLVDVNGEDKLGPCDALSFGIRFDAGRIEPGSIVTAEGEPPPCDSVPTCTELLE